MKQLLIDAGNTRLKWVALSAGRMGRVQAADWTKSSLERVARRALKGGYAQIIVCSVAGTTMERALRRAARGSGNPPPQFIRSTRRALGVRNGYAQTWRLGADRWVAMLGARSLAPGRALCIVDVGTALTLDLLDARGQHRGGLLTPGPALMVDSLLSNTAGIRHRAGSLASAHRRTGAAARTGALVPFGRSTRSGLLAGSVMACAGLIEHALREARTILPGRPKLLLAGGGARLVAQMLRVPCVRADDLVLRGLALLARPDTR